ncbi:MAG TPA: hypothetical protein ENK50_06150 [Sedimenticola sp.]|nr:hypothetical protein [Sedimenticola sp.]
MKRSAIAVGAMVLSLALGTVAQARDASIDEYGYNTEPGSAEMLLDAVVARPLTLGASIVGTIAWVITLPFSIPAGSAEKTGEEWVAGPLKYTFLRPLGDLDPHAEPDYSDYEKY